MCTWEELVTHTGPVWPSKDVLPRNLAGDGGKAGVRQWETPRAKLRPRYSILSAHILTTVDAVASFPHQIPFPGFAPTKTGTKLPFCEGHSAWNTSAQ